MGTVVVVLCVVLMVPVVIVGLAWLAGIGAALEERKNRHRSALIPLLSLTGCAPAGCAPAVRPTPIIPAAVAPAPARPAPASPEVPTRSAPLIAHSLAAPAASPKPAVKVAPVSYPPTNMTLVWTTKFGSVTYPLVYSPGKHWDSGNMAAPAGKGGGVFFIEVRENTIDGTFDNFVVFRSYSTPACNEFVQEFAHGPDGNGRYGTTLPFDGSSTYGFGPGLAGSFQVSP